MIVYRITLPKYANDLSGEGSRLFGSRWNHKGIYCLYAAESRALAMLEYAVNTTLEDIPTSLSIISYGIPNDIHTVSIDDLPQNWNSHIIENNTRDFGTNLLKEAKHIAIKIPSVIIPEEYNFLINPIHIDMKKVSIANISGVSFDAWMKK